jgi:glycosyltransferase involved in cell wall biosynthesis
LMIADEDIMTARTKEYLPGNYLFVVGSDLYARIPQNANHLAYSLARHVEQLDIVGYMNFYGGPSAPAWQRLSKGIQNMISDRTRISQEGTIRRIVIRQLHLPEPLDMMFQSFWIYPSLHPLLNSVYEVGIVSHVENVWLAAILKRAGRIRHLIYYDHDNFAGYVKSHWSTPIAWQERRCIRMADGVVSISRPLVALRQQQGARQVALIPTGVNFQQFYKAHLNRESHPPTLIFCGTLDMRWGIDLAIRALPLIREQIPEIRLLIVGDGPAEQELKGLVVSLGLDESAHFAGRVAYENVPALMAQADIGIAASRPNVFRQYASPLKIVEYMAAGLPVICSGGGEAELMIEESGAGVNIPFEPDAFAQAVLSLLTTPGKLESLRQVGIDYTRSRSWDQQGMRMARFLAQIMDQNNSRPVVS